MIALHLDFDASYEVMCDTPQPVEAAEVELVGSDDIVNDDDDDDNDNDSGSRKRNGGWRAKATAFPPTPPNNSRTDKDSPCL